MSDAERRERLYKGDVFLFSPTAASRELIGLASEMLGDAFAPSDPLETATRQRPCVKAS